MKFTLKDYQDEAVHDVLSNLRKARKRWLEDGDKHAFSLTATTGAGKTVMAAAAFEALFHGDDNFDFEADPGAVVIWFSDDPSLNEQTRFRLMEASDRLAFTDLVVVQNTFNREKFDAGQGLLPQHPEAGQEQSTGAGWRSGGGGCWGQRTLPRTAPGLRSYTIWDTIQNTIEDPDLTLYLVLDEAHRGMGNKTKQHRTTNPLSSSGSSTALAPYPRSRSSGASRPPSSDSTRPWPAQKGEAPCPMSSWILPRCRSPAC